MRQALLLVGNPNVGKSAFFNAVTGGRATVSNYPGTTVEVARGHVAGSPDRPVLDTPGVRSLVPGSEDEAVTRAAIAASGDAVIVQIADMKNLRRSLLVTLQLAQLERPIVLGLNMADEALLAGVVVDLEGLATALGIPVRTTVAIRGEGVAELLAATAEARVPHNHLALSDDAAAFMRSALLEARPGVEIVAMPHAAAAYHAGLQAHADALAARFVRKTPPGGPRLGARLARLTTHPILGWAVLALVLFSVYEIVGVLGAGILVDLIEDRLFGAIVNPALIALFAHVPFAFVRDFFVGPYGLLTVGLTYGLAIVLPIVLTFFFVFAILEDSGYLPRLAVMCDRAMRLMGLNGRAVLPMVLGLGCDTMATLTTRTLPSRKERLLTTLLLALAVPCSAQLGVILGMLSVLPMPMAAAWIATVLLVMLGVGRLAAWVIPGRPSPFVFELPPLRWPRPGNLLLKTVSRLEWYLKEALPLFLIGTALLFVLDRVGALQVITRLGEPIVTGVLGLPASASEAFLIGFLRRDFAATRLFDLSRSRLLDDVQLLVSMVTITLFIPCIANVFIIVKEHGTRTALAIVAFVFPFAFAVGGLVRILARAAGW